MSSTLEASVFMGKNYSDNLLSIRNTGNKLTMKLTLDTSEKLIVGQSVRSVEWLQLTGRILHGNIYLWLVVKKSSVFNARKGLRIFRFCIMPWKDEWEPTIKFCLGRQVDVDQKFVGIQSFGHKWWWASGIRVEYLPRIHHIAALQQSPRVPVENEHGARRFHRTDHLHVDVQWHLTVI